MRLVWRLLPQLLFSDSERLVLIIQYRQRSSYAIRGRTRLATGSHGFREWIRRIYFRLGTGTLDFAWS